MKKIILLFALILTVGTASAAKLYANFSSASNSYVSWDAANNKLKVWGYGDNTYNMFTFEAGTLSLDMKIRINIADKDHTRILFMAGSTTAKTWTFNSTGDKYQTLEQVGLTNDNVGTITAIRIGGNNVSSYSSESPYEISINPADTYLENSDVELFATFDSPGGNATYSSPTYSWTGNSNNLMKVFSLANGELANFDKLVINSSNYVTGPWRVNFAWGSGSSDNMTIGTDGKDKTFYSAGTKTITMETVANALANADKTLADITAIRIGGYSTSGSIDIVPKMVQLIGTRTIANAAFQTPSSNATYVAPTYTWKAGNSNLMNIYNFSNGELANFETLYFTTANYPNKDYRVGYYVGSTFTEFGNGFYSAGAKNVDLAAQTVDLSTVDKLSFGGRGYSSGSYSIDIQEGSVYLKTRQFTVDQKSTVCLPYALTEEEATAAGVFYELTSVADGTLHFTKVTTTEANKPYVFVPAKEYPFAEVALTKTPVAGGAGSYTVNGYKFQGVSKKEDVPNGAYGYNATNGNFSKANSENVDIKARRAYIIAEGGAGARGFLDTEFNDGTTGIQEINVQSEDAADAPAYNLAGQRVNANHKGIIIKGGKKYIVK